MTGRALNNPGVSRIGTVVMGIFAAAGVLIVTFGVYRLIVTGASEAFLAGVCMVLGGLFTWFGVSSIQEQYRKAALIDWLNQHGDWIKSKVTEVRTVTTDSVGRAESFVLVLKPIAEIKGPLPNDLFFESDVIYSRSLREDYKELEFDTVVDPENPAARYIVDVSILNAL